MSDVIYLDYAAASPLDEQVFASMQPFYTDKFHNPSATYLAAKAVAGNLSAARASVAANLGARPAEIIFTAGGTEANNLAIHGIMEQFPDGNIVVSAVEHDSVLAPSQRYDCRYAKVQTDGTIDLQGLERLIDDKTVLVSVMYANNEVGTIEPIKDIAHIIQKKCTERAALQATRTDASREASALPLYLHTDACQAANYLDLHVARLGVDLMSINGGKIYGPKQSGVLYVGARVTLQSQILGGGQERGIRSGTENVAQCVGLAEALRNTQQLRHMETERLQTLQRYFFAELPQRVPAAAINGSRKKRLPNNLHITIPGVDNERLLMQLDEAGILAAAGSACSASDDEPSHVLRAMGISELQAQASLRFTMGRATTQAHLEQLLDTLHHLCS